MKQKFIRAFGSIQELFQELSSDGKLTDLQVKQFNEAQKVIVNYHSWVETQINPVQKVDVPWSDPEFLDAWNLWKKYKKERGFTYKPIGEQSALVHLSKISKGDMATAILILKQSRSNGWSGLFSLKESKTSGTKTPANLEHKQSILDRLTRQK